MEKTWIKMLVRIQDEQRLCSAQNFPDGRTIDPLEGVIDKVGELAHARVKGRHGIRHTPAQCDAMERDAVGHVGIYLLDLATRVHIHIGGCVGRARQRGRSHRDSGHSSDQAFALLSLSVGTLAYEFHFADDVTAMTEAIGNVLGVLAYYAWARGMDLAGIMDETWD